MDLSTSQFDKIVAQLGGKKTANGFICHCPAHDDKTPSLSVSKESDGKNSVKLFCWLRINGGDSGIAKSRSLVGCKQARSPRK